MSKHRDLSKVIENGLCVACGACVAADDRIRLRLAPEKMLYEPSGPGDQAAASVCPSLNVDYERLQKTLFDDAPVAALGVVKSVLLAQSADYERNLRASSGGLIKELLLGYLSSRDADGAIVLSHSHGLLFEPTLITREEEVDSLPGSIYHCVPFEGALRLLSANEGRYVLVATPCQLEGIYNFILERRPELIERIYATIGLVCGWTYSQHSLKAVCEFKGLDFSRIESIAFRGGGPVGCLRLRFPEGEVKIDRRRDLDYMIAFDRSFNAPRCHLCINHINFLADIVVGDAWLASTSETKTGVSIVICRTDRSVEMMQTLRREGRVRWVQVTEQEMVESQSRNLVYGDFSYAYAEYLESIGKFCPDMIGPNHSSAELVSWRSVRRFYRENSRKVRLRDREKYRCLWWRKVFRDLPRYFYRYLRKLVRRRAGVGSGRSFQNLMELSGFC